MRTDPRDRLKITAVRTCACQRPDCALLEGYLRLEGIGHTMQGVAPCMFLLPLDCARAVRDTLTEALAHLADSHKEKTP